MKKTFIYLVITILTILMLLVLAGCSSSKSYTFTVETGDKIKIQLNTTDGYDISSDLPFKISKDGNTLSQGTFIKMNYCDEYINAVNNDSLAKVIDTGSTNDIEYLFYSYNNSEYNYIIKVKNSNTGILLGNPNSQEEAEKCFSLLTFSIEE